VQVCNIVNMHSSIHHITSNTQEVCISGMNVYKEGIYICVVQGVF
jgi:hypothetical protein